MKDQKARADEAARQKWTDSNDSGISIDRQLKMQKPEFWLQLQKPEDPLRSYDFNPVPYKGML